jgi:hypothetical protein
MTTAGDALNWLLQPDTCVTRKCIEDGEFMQLNQDTKQFEYRNIDGIIEVWDTFEIDAFDMLTNDWILGYIADDGQAVWKEDK